MGQTVPGAGYQAPTARCGRAAAGLRGALEHDHGDLPRGLLLVVVVGGPGGGHRLPHLRLLVRRRGARAGREAVALDLDLDVGLGLEVEEPRGRLVGAALGGDDQVVVAVLLVDQRRGALLAGAAALGGQQQHGRVLPVVALLTVGRPVAVHVLLAEQHPRAPFGCVVSAARYPAGRPLLRPSGVVRAGARLDLRGDLAAVADAVEHLDALAGAQRARADAVELRRARPADRRGAALGVAQPEGVRGAVDREHAALELVAGLAALGGRLDGAEAQDREGCHKYGDGHASHVRSLPGAGRASTGTTVLSPGDERPQTPVPAGGEQAPVGGHPRARDGPQRAAPAVRGMMLLSLGPLSHGRRPWVAAPA